jgi:hypothetical protein
MEAQMKFATARSVRAIYVEDFPDSPGMLAVQVLEINNKAITTKNSKKKSKKPFFRSKNHMTKFSAAKR